MSSFASRNLNLRSRETSSSVTNPPISVRCTHCDGDNVRMESLFGGSVSEVLYRCLDCRSFFHWVKWRDDLRQKEEKGFGR
ncbi:PaaD-like zinc ribbon domain-containing protein [Agrobacterium deltaense]|uniref:PaaD-like zinc ribbon domain-containing protein n=1 Tax=Agrobacterium deltaense TaxID=1183412 RepID=UPI003FD4DCB5